MSTTRGYLTDKQYQTITGNPSLGEEADAIINRAEAIIDGILGYWQPAVPQMQGVAAAASASSVTLAPDRRMPGIDYLVGCVIEFQSGDAVGEYRVIKGQTADGVLTLDKDFTTAPEAGDVYHIVQMGKLPRAGKADTATVQIGNTQKYMRTLPATIREAVAMQVVYMQEMGDDYFTGGAMNMKSESFGSYSYSREDGASGARAMIAPQARQALSGSGLINRTGQIVNY